MGSFIDTIVSIAKDSGIGYIISNFTEGGWRNVIMLALACVLIYLAIVKQYEPLLAHCVWYAFGESAFGKPDQ